MTVSGHCLGMTFKERILLLTEAFPDASYSKLGRIIGCSYQTVKYHTNPEFKAAQIKNGIARLRGKKKVWKSKLVQLRGGACESCGYKKCMTSLDFHHRDPTQKVREIGRSPSFNAALIEAAKCLLLCANCHREHHEKENDLSALQKAGIRGVGDKRAWVSNPCPLN